MPRRGLRHSNRVPPSIHAHTNTHTKCAGAVKGGTGSRASENPPCHLRWQQTFTRGEDGDFGTNLCGRWSNHVQTHTHTLRLSHNLTHPAVDEERTALRNSGAHWPSEWHHPNACSPDARHNRRASGQGRKVTAISMIELKAQRWLQLRLCWNSGCKYHHHSTGWP